jgi:hypothetical protein
MAEFVGREIVVTLAAICRRFGGKQFVMTLGAGIGGFTVLAVVKKYRSATVMEKKAVFNSGTTVGQVADKDGDNRKDGDEC